MAMQSCMHIVCLVVLLHAVASQGPSCQQSNWGRRFTISFLSQFSFRTNGELELQIIAQGTGVVNTTCFPPRLSQIATVTAGQVTKVAVNATFHMVGNGISSTRCIVSATVDIAIFVLDTIEAHSWLSVEGFLVLPDDVLSTDYVAASYGQESQIMVMCLSRCNVNITLSQSADSVYIGGRNYTSGDTAMVHLDHESLQLSNTGDLSATRVHSDSPVAVYGGARCANVPSGVLTCDFLLEQMIPTDTWGVEYILPGIYPRLQTVVRVFSSEENTTFTVFTRDTASSQSFRISSPTEYQKLQFHDTQLPVAITSNTPIMVVEYSPGHSIDMLPGGPFMVVVPAVKQFASGTVSFPSIPSPRYMYLYTTVAVTVRTSELHLLTTSGLDRANNYTKPVPSPLLDYSVIYMNTSQQNGDIVLTSPPNVRYGAMVYSVDSTVRTFGYGFSLGMRFHKTDNCQSTGIPVPTGTMSTHLTSPLTSMQPSPPAGTWHSRTCFDCREVTEWKYCNTVKICLAEEVCFVSSYTTTEGHVKRRSGCIHHSSCGAGRRGARRAPDSPCLSCCDADLCNSRGCGDTGFGPRNQRGPLCLDCSHVGNVSTCDQVTLCKSNELCSIEEYSWGDGDRRYQLGCKGNTSCIAGVRRSVSELHERSVPVCQACCTSDFCNRNCTSPAIIPGPIG